MTSEEFVAMRATIRERGTARMALIPIIFIGWAATAIATAAIITVAVSTLVPLLVLAAGFEAIFALHVNVERIGRYLQVFHEETAGGSGWEHVAMAYGQKFKAGGPDALFSRLFVLAVSANFLPAALGGEIAELIVVAVLHVLLINHIRVARNYAARQRAEDLQRFQSLRSPGAPSAGGPTA